MIPTPRPMIPTVRTPSGGVRRMVDTSRRWALRDGVWTLRPAAGCVLIATGPAEGRVSWALMVEGVTVAHRNHDETTLGAIADYAIAYLR